MGYCHMAVIVGDIPCLCCNTFQISVDSPELETNPHRSDGSDCFPVMLPVSEEIQKRKQIRCFGNQYNSFNMSDYRIFHIAWYFKTD